MTLDDPADRGPSAQFGQARCPEPFRPAWIPSRGGGGSFSDARAARAGLSLQCFALYRNGGPGLYLSTDDARAYRKAFAFQGAPPDMLGYEVIDYPDASTSRARNYSVPYRAVVGAFRGDWITVAGRSSCDTILP